MCPWPHDINTVMESPNNSSDMENNEKKIDPWLKAVGKTYSSLTDAERNQTLDYLIGKSGASQLLHLSDKLESFLKRDFLKLLPIEVTFHLLQYFDAKSLQTACCVCKEWCAIITGCTAAWMRVGANIGVKVQPCNNFISKDGSVYKKLFQKIADRQRRLNDPRADEASSLEAVTLFGHQDRVMALYYKDGWLASGSDDRTVRIWDCDTGSCLKIISTHTVADVKFDKNFVVTASFDACAACWEMKSGMNLSWYLGHTAAVFTVDYNVKVNLLVTGSADGTVKVWTFRSGELLRTLPHQHSGWVTQVVLCAQPSDEGDYFILSQDNKTVYEWKLTFDHIAKLNQCHAGHEPRLPGLFQDGESFSFCGVSVVQEKKIVLFMSQLGKQDAKPTATDITDRFYYSITHFLGTGKCFSAFLCEEMEIPVLEIKTADGKKVVTTIPLPPFRLSKRGSNITLGNRDWLDGFDGQNDRGLFFAATLRDHSIYLLNWKNEGYVG